MTTVKQLLNTFLSNESVGVPTLGSSKRGNDNVAILRRNLQATFDARVRQRTILLALILVLLIVMIAAAMNQAFLGPEKVSIASALAGIGIAGMLRMVQSVLTEIERARIAQAVLVDLDPALIKTIAFELAKSL